MVDYVQAINLKTTQTSFMKVKEVFLFDNRPEDELSERIRTKTIKEFQRLSE